MSATVSSSFIAMRAKVVADVVGRRDRVRVAVRALRVHVDQTHLHRGERVLQIAPVDVGTILLAAMQILVGHDHPGIVAGLSLAVAHVTTQPCRLGAPVDVLVRLPGVLATAGEAEGLEAHRFQRDVAGEDHQVGPGNLAAVLLLDRPQQAAGFVEADVVRPAVERREALLASAAAAAAVAGAVGAGAVPGHADEQGAVVPEVRRPPVLRVGHQRGEILLHRRQVEALELLRVVEVLAHRIGLGGMLVQELESQLVRPPVAVRRAAAGDVVEGALGFG